MGKMKDCEGGGLWANERLGIKNTSILFKHSTDNIRKTTRATDK